MAIYTVHVPEQVSDAVAQADRTAFLRDGFSVRAFLFGLPYLLWHRAWIASAVWVAAIILIAVLGLVLHPPLALTLALVGLMHLYLGVEGPDLARESLARRGLPLVDLVSAASLSEAEAVFFARRVVPTAPPKPRAVPLPAIPAVIGFADGEGP